MSKGKLEVVRVVVFSIFLVLAIFLFHTDGEAGSQLPVLPVVINTWPFTNATEKGT